MSRRIRKVVLTSNMTFTGVDGGYGDIRTDFTASETIRLSVDTEFGGVLVERGGQSMTLFPSAISRIEWAQEAPKQQKPKDAA